LALATAAASEPVPDALVLATVNVDSSRRSSSSWSRGRSQRRSLRRARGNLFRPDREEQFHGAIPTVSRLISVSFHKKSQGTHQKSNDDAFAATETPPACPTMPPLVYQVLVSTDKNLRPLIWFLWLRLRLRLR
jgi:hypothetical protein